MRSYEALIALLIVHGFSALSNAGIVIVDSEAFVETSGTVRLDDGEPNVADWADDDTDTFVATASGAALFPVSGPAASGSGEANATITNFGGGRLRLESSVNIVLEQLDPLGIGDGRSASDAFIEFDLTTPTEITSVDGASGDIFLDVNGDQLLIVTGAPGASEVGVGTQLAVGTYTLSGVAETMATMIAGGGDVSDTNGFVIDVTFTAIPEPSAITFLTLVCSFLGCAVGVRYAMNWLRRD